MSKSLERRIRNLESEAGLGEKYILRIIFDAGVIEEGGHYREIRHLMVDDGSKKGRFIRTLERGEIVEGIEQEPWLTVDDTDEDV